MFGLTEELIKKVESKSSYFYKVFKSCLKVRDEQVLIISDHGQEGNQLANMFGYGYYHAAKNKNYAVQLLFQEVKKGFMHAEEEVTRTLVDLKPGSIIVICVSDKLGRMGEMKSFRKFCHENGHRFISATGLGDANNNHFDLFMESININYSRLAKKGVIIKKILDKAKEVRIKTAAGTDLIFNVEGMIAITNVGDYKIKGSGGNMPAGEVYIPPRGYYGVKGVVVIDGSMKTQAGAILLNDPIKIFVEEGRIVKIEGPQAHLLEETFNRYENRAKYPWRVRHIGELGIGINPGAIIIGSTIIDEKVLGTAHIGVGNNYWFGGEIKTVFHGDYIFKNPEIFVDGKKIEI